MDIEEILKIVDISSDIGFRHVKLTGGEPTLREDLFKIISHCSKKELEELQLVTNGSNITREYAMRLKEAGLCRITISLDTSNPDTFLNITQRDLFFRVIEGVYASTEAGLNVTINSVIMKSNKAEIEGLIDIAKSAGAKLKLLDYINVENSVQWHSEYLPFKNLRKYLHDRSVGMKWVFPPGGLGTPMQSFFLEGGTEVIVKDATIGTNYHESCKICSKYPCQDALISLRITHDGKLKRCLIRDDNLVDVLTPLRRGNIHEVRSLIEGSYKVLTEAQYYPNAWSPECEKS